MFVLLQRLHFKLLFDVMWVCFCLVVCHQQTIVGSWKLVSQATSCVSNSLLLLM